MYPRPNIAQSILLVYVECACGEWDVQKEGGFLRTCSECGEKMTPGGGGSLEARREFGLGFVATLMTEQEAVTVTTRNPVDGCPRHYAPEDIAAFLSAQRVVHLT